MITICPTVTAYDIASFHTQMKLVSSLASRIHIDAMDGEFAPEASPGLSDIKWPHHVQADLHLMYQRPMESIDQLRHLKPHMVIIHNEAYVHHMQFAAELHKDDIQVGLAILHDTPIECAEQIMHSFDHVLIFSGHLGYHGGQADMELLNKVRFLKYHHPEVEIGWDGGINDNNVAQLIEAGVSVLNVGGFIHSSEHSSDAYARLKDIAEKH
jgi:ribulose-phosphate 3-epimerase